MSLVGRETKRLTHHQNANQNLSLCRNRVQLSAARLRTHSSANRAGGAGLSHFTFGLFSQRDLARAHFMWVRFAVEENEAFDPAEVSFLRSE